MSDDDHRHSFFDNWPSENRCHECGKSESVIRAEAKVAKVAPVLAAASTAATEYDFYR